MPAFSSTTKCANRWAWNGLQGAHVHIAGRNARGLQVIEVWESQQDIDRFMNAGLGKAMQAPNLPQPTITDFEVQKLDWTG